MGKRMIVFVLVLALASSASALLVDGYQESNERMQIFELGGLEITSTGHAVFNTRVDHDECDVIIHAGGILTTNDTYKLGEEGFATVYVNGTWNAHDIENYGQEHEAMIYMNVNGVINLQTGYRDGGPFGRYDPLHWANEGSLVLDPSLDPSAWFILIEDMGGGACMIYVPEPTTIVVLALGSLAFLRRRK
jgi:hypothetical protein